MLLLSNQKRKLQQKFCVAYVGSWTWFKPIYLVRSLDVFTTEQPTKTMHQCCPNCFVVNCNLRNIQHQLQLMVFAVSSTIPAISTSSPTRTCPVQRPVATVPRPVIENTSSTGIMNGLSTVSHELGWDVWWSALQPSNSMIFLLNGQGRLASKTFKSRTSNNWCHRLGKSYSVNGSRTLFSTNSATILQIKSNHVHFVQKEFYNDVRNAITLRDNGMCSEFPKAWDHQQQILPRSRAPSNEQLFSDHVFNVVRGVSWAVHVKARSGDTVSVFIRIQRER